MPIWKKNLSELRPIIDFVEFGGS
jgi:hypothetical protein